MKMSAEKKLTKCVLCDKNGYQLFYNGDITMKTEDDEDRRRVTVEIAYRTAIIQIVGEWCVFYRMFINREGVVVLEQLQEPCACRFHVLKKADPHCVKSLGVICDAKPFPNTEALLREYIQALSMDCDSFWSDVD